MSGRAVGLTREGVGVWPNGPLPQVRSSFSVRTDVVGIETSRSAGVAQNAAEPSLNVRLRAAPGFMA